jgi:hypothetical protein
MTDPSKMTDAELADKFASIYGDLGFPNDVGVMAEVEKRLRAPRMTEAERALVEAVLDYEQDGGPEFHLSNLPDCFRAVAAERKEGK